MIVALPAATPVTEPEPSTVAINGSDVDHMPAGVALVSIVVEPTQTELLPVMDATTGRGLTITTLAVLVTDVQGAAPSIVTVYEPASAVVAFAIVKFAEVAPLILGLFETGVAPLNHW